MIHAFIPRPLPAHLRTGLGVALLAMMALCELADADELKDLGKDGERTCTGTLSLFIDEEEKWRRPMAELRELDSIVEIGDERQKTKLAIPLASLIGKTPNVIAVEVSTCTGKLRRFEAAELERKRDSLYLIITGYRGLKLHNTAGGEKKKKGNRLKGIDRVRLITADGKLTPPG